MKIIHLILGLILHVGSLCAIVVGSSMILLALDEIPTPTPSPMSWKSRIVLGAFGLFMVEWFPWANRRLSKRGN